MKYNTDVIKNIFSGLWIWLDTFRKSEGDGIEFYIIIYYAPYTHYYWILATVARFGGHISTIIIDYHSQASIDQIINGFYSCDRSALRVCVCEYFYVQSQQRLFMESRQSRKYCIQNFQREFRYFKPNAGTFYAFFFFFFCLLCKWYENLFFVPSIK